MKKIHPLHKFFFKKFQEQVSKAPGFKPLLSYEDFLSMVEQTNAQSSTSKTESIASDKE